MKQNHKFKETEIGMIPEDWELVQFGEICLKEKGSIISGPFGSNIGSKYFVEKGVPVIRGNNLSTDFKKIIDTGFVFVTEEKANELKTWAIEDDLVFTAAGTLGQVGIIPKKRDYPKYIISNKQLRARVDKHKVVPLYVYYWFQSKKMVEYINLRNTGSTIPLINLSVLRSLPLPKPQLKEQEEIVDILSSLDDKIELNRQINATLEKIGQALFKHWFIDFEFPNEKGRPYKSSGGEMVDSELGKIPKGWGVKKLRDFISVERGLSYKGSGLCMNGTPMVNLGNIAPNNHFRYDGLKFYSGDFKERNLVKPGDLIIANTDITQKREVLGSCLIVPSDLGHEKVLFTHHIYAVRHKDENEVLPNHFLSYLFQAPQYRERATGFATGTTVLALPEDAILDFNFAVPNEILMNDFNKIIKSIKNKSSINNIDNKNLSQIRDSLLPRLMSGRIRVPIEAMK